MLRQRAISTLLRSSPKRPQRIRNSFIDGVKKFFDDIAFENWAPRSSRTWRLNLPPKQEQQNQDPDKGWNLGLASDQLPVAKLWETLEEEVLRSQLDESDPPQPIDNPIGWDPESGEMSSEATDDELTDELNERIKGMAQGSVTDEPQLPITGEELRQLIFGKYQRTYDVSFARRDLWGKPIVSLNIMWNYLEQKSFPLSEGQLMEKYDRFAIYLNAWQQANRVREFLTSPRKAKGGLPSRPIIGIAVSFQLELSPSIIAEWFDKI